jgi:hypothetical protein
MKSVRLTFLLAGLLLLSASALPAQASRVSCKDGTQPKVGHFSCWGHGGLVSGAVKPAATTEAKRTSKVATKKKSTSKARKPVGKKAHSTAAKADKKAQAKRAAKTAKH